MGFKTELPGSRKERAFINFVVDALVASNGKTWGQMGVQVALEILDKYNISHKQDRRPS